MMARRRRNDRDPSFFGGFRWGLVFGLLTGLGLAHLFFRSLAERVAGG